MVSVKAKDAAGQKNAMQMITSQLIQKKKNKCLEECACSQLEENVSLHSAKGILDTRNIKANFLHGLSPQRRANICWRVGCLFLRPFRTGHKTWCFFLEFQPFVFDPFEFGEKRRVLRGSGVKVFRLAGKGANLCVTHCTTIDQ